MTKQLKCVLFSFFMIQMTVFAQNSSTKKRPNIVMILVDDLKPLLGAYGDSLVVSPNIDKLSNMGMRFDLAYVNQAVCGPSRYNLMLGSRSTSTGLYSFGKDFRSLYPNAVTLPQYFMNAGFFYVFFV